MGLNVTDLGCAIKEKKELKKHAATIHCSNTLSLLQRKITNALLYHAYKELMLKDEHEITVKQLCRLIGYQGNNHGVIKDALKGLISTVIEWNLIDDVTGLENWTASSIIASVSLEGSFCYYAYSPRMKQLLYTPSMFGKIDLVIQARFRSSYGLALYENCIRYRGLPYTKWFEMDLFKKLMGVPAGKYDIFRDFKRRVLDKATHEVNQYSDLIIAAEFIREGRKVIKVRFKLKERPKKTRIGNKANQEPSTLKQQLIQHFLLSEEQADSVLTEYDHAFIKEKITGIETSKAYQDHKILNLSAYLLSALKNNYQLGQSSGVVQPLRDLNQESDLCQLKRQVEDIWHEYHIYKERVIHETINTMSENVRKKFMDEFYQFAKPTMDSILKLQRNKYNPENILESPQMQALLRQFALRELDFLSLIPIEEFVATQPEKLAAWQRFKSYDPDHPLLRNLD